MTRSFRIAGRDVGHGSPCFVIAEAGVNHNGDLALARTLVDIARDAGADAVKFQTFRAERLAAASAPKADYQKRTTDADESQVDMLKKLELSDDAFRELAEYCDRKGILFLSTPFDELSADFLETLGMAAYKVPSGEVTNLPYLEHIARKGKPMIVSTGMADLGEVEQAVASIEGAGNAEFALLHCVSNYPADPADVNLRAMDTMREAFGKPVGYSDHTEGIAVSLAAVSRGACVIEKHFTSDRNLPGPDQKASLEPGELRELVRGIRTIETALGSTRKTPSAAERNTASVARKSLVAARDLANGTTLDAAMLIAKRPGTGISPALLRSITGRKLRRDVRADELLRLEDLE